MRISDWSSDVCSSDLRAEHTLPTLRTGAPGRIDFGDRKIHQLGYAVTRQHDIAGLDIAMQDAPAVRIVERVGALVRDVEHLRQRRRSAEHTSELQSLMRISYAVFCLKKKKHTRIMA